MLVPELFPAWSPDGREIAFVRANQGVFVVSPRRRARTQDFRHRHASCMVGSSKSVLIRDHQGETPFGIWQINLDTLEKRRITQPSSGIGDWTFAVSPDNSMLAFGRCTRTAMGDLYVLPMAGGSLEGSPIGTCCPEVLPGLPMDARSYMKSGRNSGVFRRADGNWEKEPRFHCLLRE